MLEFRLNLRSRPNCNKMPRACRLASLCALSPMNRPSTAITRPKLNVYRRRIMCEIRDINSTYFCAGPKCVNAKRKERGARPVFAIGPEPAGLGYIAQTTLPIARGYQSFFQCDLQIQQRHMIAILRVRFTTNTDAGSVWSEDVFNKWMQPLIPFSLGDFWCQF